MKSMEINLETNGEEIIENTRRVKKGGRKVKSTHKYFMERLYKSNEKYRNGEFEIVGEYTSMRNSIACKCKNDGNLWYPKADNLLHNNHGCPKCRDNSRMVKLEEFKRRLVINNIYFKNGDFEIAESTYKGVAKSIMCKCKCGHTWTPNAQNLLVGNRGKGCGCPICNGYIKPKSVTFKFKDNISKFKSISQFTRHINSSECTFNRHLRQIRMVTKTPSMREDTYKKIEKFEGGKFEIND